MDKSPPKPPPRTATSREANMFSWKTSPVRPHDKSMQPRLTKSTKQWPMETTATMAVCVDSQAKLAKRYKNTFWCSDPQAIDNLQKRIWLNRKFKEIQRDWTSSESDSDKGHNVADDYPLLRPQPIHYTRNPSIEQRPAMTLNLADHSSGGQATPTHESITTLPVQGTSNRNFTIAPSNMKRSPRSDNLQALQGNEPQFKPTVPARKTSLTKASTSLTHISNEPTPHWREQL